MAGPLVGGARRDHPRQALGRRREIRSSLRKKVFEGSLWETLIQDPSARRTKDSQPSAFGFEYCASHVRFRVFQQTARGVFPPATGLWVVVEGFYTASLKDAKALLGELRDLSGPQAQAGRW